MAPDRDRALGVRAGGGRPDKPSAHKQFVHTDAIDRPVPVNPGAMPRMKGLPTEPARANRRALGIAHAPINPASRSAALRTNRRRPSQLTAQAQPHGNQPPRQ